MTTARTPSADVIRGFNPYLHGARGLFALMIVFYHVVNSKLPTFGVLDHGAPLFMLRSLEHGVELFFGVSGVVIVGALSRARGPLVFAIERGTRIYPVLWASIIVIVILAFLTHYEGRGVPGVQVFAANLLALPPLIPSPLLHPAAWSLSYELCFYGFCALAWALRRRIGAWSLWLVVPLALALIEAHPRAILMPVGMAVAAALARRPGWARRRLAPGVALLVFLAAWEGVCVQNHSDLMDVSLLGALHGWAAVLAPLAVAAATLMFAGVLGGHGVYSRILKSPTFQFFGTISYSLYLWHPIVMSVIKHELYVTHVVDNVGRASQLVFLLVVLPPSLAIAWASQRVLERRVTVWLRRRLEGLLAPSPRPKPPATTLQTAIEPSAR